MAINYVISWILDFILIALLVAVIDEAFHQKIEYNQGLAAFLIFVLPTLVEAISYYYVGKPFMFGFAV